MASTAVPRPDCEDAPALMLSRERLIEVLTDTVVSLDALDLSLATEGVEGARRLRARLVGEVRDQVLPRLADADAPAIVVVGGSTGAGKSTLVNSVLDQEVSQAGVLRPTTRTPVLVTSPEDAVLLAEHPLAQVCRTVTCEVVPAGLAVVDASDLDSVNAENRRLAARLMEAADLWLFVTTAARYGDRTPWVILEQAASRGTSVAVVLNRVPQESLRVVRRDLLERLELLGLSDAPLFVVPDVGPNEGPLDEAGVTELRDWLRVLAGRHRASGLINRTGRGLWTSMRADLTALADSVDAQADAAMKLHQTTSEIPAGLAQTLREDAEEGRMGEGAASARWVSLASAGGPLASLSSGSRLGRGLLGRGTRARADALAEVSREVRTSLVARLCPDLIALRAEVERVWEGSGAVSVLPVASDVSSTARAVVDRWAETTHGEVASSTRALPAGLTQEAAGDLVVAAAAGVHGTSQVTERLGLEPAASAARRSLAGALVAALTDATPDSALSLVPAPSLAAALRLRAGELTPLTRPGASS